MAHSNIFCMRIVFNDCDPAQIAYFTHYFRWFDTGSHALFTTCGIPSWHETLATHGIIGTPSVDVGARFVNSTTYGEVRVFAIRFPGNILRIKAIPIPEDFRTLCE